MQAQQAYPYEYFAGANVFVLVNNEPILEVAGISYNEMDSQQPIYGYSSRLFDTVAPGQKIIQGKLVVNLVSPNYLHDAVTFNNASSALPASESSEPTSAPTPDFRNPRNGNVRPQYDQREAIKKRDTTWGTQADPNERITLEDITQSGPVDIRIEFANKFSIVLDSCFFISKSSVIQIDEHVILEEFSFFARNSHTERLGS